MAHLLRGKPSPTIHPQILELLTPENIEELQIVLKKPKDSGDVLLNFLSDVSDAKLLLSN